MCCNCKVVTISIAVLGAILLVLGLILGFAVLPGVVEDEIAKQVRLEVDSEQYERWVVTPVPFKFKVHIFHVENVDEIMSGTAKPKVVQKGPYVYKENREKVDVSYDEPSDSLTYKQTLRFEFDKESSAPLTEDDMVTVLNVPLQGVLQLAEDKGLSNALSGLWKSMFPDTTSFFHEIRVGDLLFDGYKFCDPDAPTSNVLVKNICKRVQSMTESQTIIVDDAGASVFSFFSHKQRLHDGPYVINAGNEDVHQVGAILKWKDLDYIDSWVVIDENENQCNKIRGRDSSIYPPLNNDTSEFDIFNTDICRIVRLKTVSESSYKDVDGNVAKLGVDALSNKDSAACYCTKETKNLDGVKECFPEGFGDMYSCLKAPVVLSFPHFLWADERYSATVEGLSPVEDDHSTFVLMEPGTGTPLKGAKRIQFNMVLREIDSIAESLTVSKAMMPILWVEEGVELTDELVQKIKDDYLDKLVLVDVVTYVLIGVGALLLVVGLGVFAKTKCC